MIPRQHTEERFPVHISRHIGPVIFKPQSPYPKTRAIELSLGGPDAIRDARTLKLLTGSFGLTSPLSNRRTTAQRSYRNPAIGPKAFGFAFPIVRVVNSSSLERNDVFGLLKHPPRRMSVHADRKPGLPYGPRAVQGRMHNSSHAIWPYCG